MGEGQFYVGVWETFTDLTRTWTTRSEAYSYRGRVKEATRAIVFLEKGEP